MDAGIGSGPIPALLSGPTIALNCTGGRVTIRPVWGGSPGRTQPGAGMFRYMGEHLRWVSTAG